MDVSNRTVSRWETGSNLPDIAILIELSDFYAVDLREILDGERKDQRMEKETENTILKVAEYNQEESKQFFSRWRMLFTFGLVISVANLTLQRIDIVEEGFWRNFAAFIQGLSDGGVTAVMIVYDKSVEKIIEAKERLFTRLGILSTPIVFYEAVGCILFVMKTSHSFLEVIVGRRLNY